MKVAATTAATGSADGIDNGGFAGDGYDNGAGHGDGYAGQAYRFDHNAGGSNGSGRDSPFGGAFANMPSPWTPRRRMWTPRCRPLRHAIGRGFFADFLPPWQTLRLRQNSTESDSPRRLFDECGGNQLVCSGRGSTNAGARIGACPIDMLGVWGDWLQEREINLKP